ncbi:hypothetical protein D7S86_12055 [Pararobbsia silviterrae]|uniref:Uncharacterized protein n=1 Tax=Pararobbsia silviterrae TaxID=1792498 RepID=A0A494XZI5_9BURK|nr:hypothetical protein D7S86_12055 [Pararobbsia silviterrae]
MANPVSPPAKTWIQATRQPRTRRLAIHGTHAQREAFRDVALGWHDASGARETTPFFSIPITSPGTA